MARPVIPFIDLKAQYEAVRSDVHARMKVILERGAFIMGPEVAEMETLLAEWTGATHCISVASGTDALLIALMALGLEPGDEVITTPFSFIATAEAIALAGGIPIFVDVEPDTANIDVKRVEERISDRTRVIIPVSLYGQPADMDEINLIARRHGLHVIEDAAQSFGSTYKTNRSCNLSDFGCTSFFPSKPLGAYGDGGAIFLNDDGLAKLCAQIRVHGQSERYVHPRIGINGRMDTLQCAVILAKFDRFKVEIEQRLSIGARYNAKLDDIGIERIVQRPDRTSAFAQFTVMVDDRGRIQSALNARGIPTAVHYPTPINRQGAYAHFDPAHETPVADLLARRVLSLPMSADLSQATQDQIVEALAAALV